MASKESANNNGLTPETIEKTLMARFWIYERALKACPGSYKLWKHYLDERVEQVLLYLNNYRDKPHAMDPRRLAAELEYINGLYERALNSLYQMPRLWLDYANFLMRQRRLTQVRTTLDRALRALPFTLHERIWTGAYLRLAEALSGTKLADEGVRIWSRYWRVAADRGLQAVAMRHVNYLIKSAFFDEAAALLVELAMREAPQMADNDIDEATWLPGNYWQQLCTLIVEHGETIVNTPVEIVMRAAIERSQRFEAGNRASSYVTGIFWNALATWHIRGGRVEEARRIFEEALYTVTSVRDFALLFDAYTKMEETLIDVLVSKSTLQRPQSSKKSSTNEDMINRIMSKLERLLNQRPFLLLDVRIRKNRGDVSLWMERIALTRMHIQEHGVEATIQLDPFFKQLNPTESNPNQDPINYLYEAAAGTTSLKKGMATLWLSYAKYVWDTTKEWKNAVKVMQSGLARGCEDEEELASLWIGFAEMVIQEQGLDAAADLLAEPLCPISKAGGADKGKRLLKHHHGNQQHSLYRNARLWNFFLDVEEARGHVEAVRAAYERVIELGIATATNFINYALFLLQNKPDSPDAAFRIFERGIAAFGNPIAFELWNVYLPKFTAYWENRSGGMERIRDLYEQALRGLSSSSETATVIFIEYAAAEERAGNIRHSLAIISRAIHNIVETKGEEDRRIELYELLLAKTQKHLGAIATRPIFEDALTTLPISSSLVSLAIRYATLETSLGEVERARAIYIHTCSQFDPHRYPAIWSAWQEFETVAGTEHTFRDMLRVRRAALAKSTMSVQFIPEKGNTEES